MKLKKIEVELGILFMCIFMMSTGAIAAFQPKVSQLASTPKSTDAPDLEFQDIKGGFGVSGFIHNNGTGNATNITWFINYTGGILFFGRTSTEEFVGIDAGTAVYISSGFVFGFGRTTITFTATCTEGDTATKNVTGTVFTFLVFGVK